MWQLYGLYTLKFISEHSEDICKYSLTTSMRLWCSCFVSHLCKKRFNVISGSFPGDQCLVLIWKIPQSLLHPSFHSPSPPHPSLPLFSYFLELKQTHKHTDTQVHSLKIVFFGVCRFWDWSLDLPNTSAWPRSSRCLRQRSSFIFWGGNPQFGSRKFPHPVCLQRPAVHCGAGADKALGTPLYIQARHQTIRMTAGIITLLCGTYYLLFHAILLQIFTCGYDIPQTWCRHLLTAVTSFCFRSINHIVMLCKDL